MVEKRRRPCGLLWKGNAESGPGRWLEYRIEGLRFDEYLAMRRHGQNDREPDLKDFGDFLTVGGFPEHASEEPSSLVREKIKQDIVDKAIYHDLIQMSGDSGIDIERVRRLFVYFVQAPGTIFNAKNIAKYLEAKEPSVRNWLDLLRKTRLVLALDQYSKTASGSLKRSPHPKIYPFDHGIVTAFSSLPRPLSDPQLRGRVMETVVYRHLRDLVGGTAGDIFYYRWKNLQEVDLVVRHEERIIAIEVTAGADARSEKVKKFKTALGGFKHDRAVLIHGGTERGSRKGFAMLPLDRFLMQPASVLGEDADA